MTSRSPDQNPRSSSPFPSSSPTNSRFRYLCDKFRSSLLKPRKYLSIIYPFIHHFLSKTLEYLSMDTMLPPLDDDEVSNQDRPLTPPRYPPDPEVEEDRLFFVPHWWWSEARESLGESSDVTAVLYSAKSSTSPAGTMDSETSSLYNEIVVNLKRVDVSTDKSSSSEGRAYALVSEWMFLRALKW